MSFLRDCTASHEILFDPQLKLAVLIEENVRRYVTSALSANCQWRAQ